MDCDEAAASTSREGQRRRRIDRGAESGTLRFWDSSALVPLLAKEVTTPSINRIYREDRFVFVWWTTELECVSALTRRERSQDLSSRGLVAALQRLDALKHTWSEMEPHRSIRDTARRMLRTHPLRAGDALQLAAAIVAAEGRPESLEFVSLDSRLVEAARKEGLHIIETS